VLHSCAHATLTWASIRTTQQALMLSQGTPMMLMGDEYGHTKGGNNNTYGLDGARLRACIYPRAARVVTQVMRCRRAAE
jgi:hypothetical protein